MVLMPNHVRVMGTPNYLVRIKSVFVCTQEDTGGHLVLLQLLKYSKITSSCIRFRSFPGISENIAPQCFERTLTTVIWDKERIYMSLPIMSLWDLLITADDLDCL